MLKSVPLLEHLTAQDRVECAIGLRALATQCETDAAERVNPTQREIPLSAARVYRELAARCAGGQLDSQALIYCAAGQRMRAVQAEKQAASEADPTQREIRVAAARSYRDLALKCERIARRMSGSGGQIA